MNNKLAEIIKQTESARYATDAGLVMHAKLQGVRLGQNSTGDQELIQKIESSDNELKSFFSQDSKTEVPVAGVVNGRFLSRRIDRMIVDDNEKNVQILDYKTDINPDTYRAKYIVQLREYVSLLKQIYPKYTVSAYILWLHNWTLERII